MTFASGRSMAKLPTFDSTSRRSSPRRNLPYRSSRSAFEVCPVISGRSNRAAIPRSCLRYWPMIRTRSSGAVVQVEQQRDEVVLDGVLAGQAELIAPLGHGVLHPAVVGQAEPD